MSRSHGLAGEFGAHAWATPSRTPLYYPDAVTLVPGADRATLVSRIDTVAPGASVKDSFADLDLTEADFQVLFEGQWIHRPASAPALAPDLSWDVAGDPDIAAGLGARLGRRGRQCGTLPTRTTRRPS